jgi:glyoxylase-like metal-dependent hydrolase (beta-lactamase superfamily II)
MRRAICLVVLLATSGCATWAPAPAAPDPAARFGARPVAEGIVLFPGTFPQGMQPDGNSVMLAAPDGWIVLDTGRHPEHTQRLLGYATATDRPIAAIVNTHWHLDHSSGNRMLRDAYPAAPVYATDAVDGAMAGFLADSLAQGRAMIEGGSLSEPMLAAVQLSIRTISDSEALRPTVVVAQPQTLSLAGRPLRIGVAQHAVTAGDLWLFDPATRVLLAGDLVTWPVPFLDTACPAGWQAALDDVAATGFTLLVPGHGEPMRRADFDAWRGAFDAMLACEARGAAPATCAEDWIAAAGDRLPAAEHPRVREMFDYYFTRILRGPDDRTRKYCPSVAAGEAQHQPL